LRLFLPRGAVSERPQGQVLSLVATDRALQRLRILSIKPRIVTRTANGDIELLVVYQLGTAHA
jgi:hypothetical protein